MNFLTYIIYQEVVIIIHRKNSRGQKSKKEKGGKNTITMHNNTQRTKILGVWFFLLAFENSRLAITASPGGGGWGIHGTSTSTQSSFVRILGNVFDGCRRKNDSKHEHCGLSRSSRISTSELLSLDDWTNTKSTSSISSIDNDTKSTKHKNIDRGVVGEKQSRFRRTTPRETLVAKKQRSRRGLDRRHIGEDHGYGYGYGYGEEYYDTCCDASLSATAVDMTAMTSPIVPLTISFDGQTGEEFADPETMDRLVASGLEMATQDKNDWIEWKMHSSTKKLLEENNNNEMAILEQGEVMVYIGKSKKDGHGSNLPIIKTKSILPLAAEEMAELLMDSSRVKIYNKLSVGRTDVRTLGEGTKIVCNLTKPPIAKSNMVSCTMMHSRRLEQPQESYFVVSRATPGMVDDAMSDLPRNDILLGVNLLEDRGPNECIMTAVTHIYSPALPTILAKKMGVSSAINFVKDIRNSCASVGS